MGDIVVFDDGGMSSYHLTEHYYKCMLAGDLAGVRDRLAAAMEKLGYDLIDDGETIIRGRRGARGWATSWSSADVLEYPATLAVKLKPQSEHAVRATFDYTVKHPSLSDSEKEILTREAEAIAALASARGVDAMCSSCGNSSNDDSRFCRRCGSPLTREHPELEVLRLSSEVRAGLTSLSTAGVLGGVSLGLIIWAVIALYVSGVVFSKGVMILGVLGLAGYLSALISVYFGWNRSRRALTGKPQTPALPEPPRFAPATAPPAATLFAVPADQPYSVTDNTTKLLEDDTDPAKTGEFR